MPPDTATTTQAPLAPAHPRAGESIDSIVESPRARKALAEAGFKTLGDIVAAGGMRAVRDIRWVGEATQAMLAAALGPMPEPKEAEHEVEEGEHPLQLESPFLAFKLLLHPSRKVLDGTGGFALQDNLFLEFEGGRAKLTRRQWLTMRCNRDESQVDTLMRDPKLPWRREASEWLKGRQAYGRGDLRILPD